MNERAWSNVILFGVSALNYADHYGVEVNLLASEGDDARKGVDAEEARRAGVDRAWVVNRAEWDDLVDAVEAGIRGLLAKGYAPDAIALELASGGFFKGMERAITLDLFDLYWSSEWGTFALTSAGLEACWCLELRRVE